MAVTNVRAKESGLADSAVLAADTAVKTEAGKVYWISVTDSADLSIELNDSADNSGTDRWAMKLDIDVINFGHFVFDPPIEFHEGIYCDVSTTTCLVTIGWV